MSAQDRKAVRDSENTWQLEGESDLAAIIIPDPPKAGGTAIIRLTHSNSYGPFDEAEIFIRLGNPAQRTGEFDLDTKKDRIKAKLVEELVYVDDEEILRSEAQEPFEDETPWDGTYEAQLVIPTGQHSIEIKIVSSNPELLASRVLSDWDVSVK